LHLGSDRAGRDCDGRAGGGAKSSRFVDNYHFGRFGRLTNAPWR
jgi:hypothetical protein